MGFECPNQLNGYCKLNESECSPTLGKCVLAGKVKLMQIKPKESDSNKK